MRALHLLLIALSVFLSGCEPYEDHDSDAVLLKTFRDKRATFEELLTMIQADRGLERVADSWTHPDPPRISPERLSKYRQNLKSIGCDQGFEHFTGKPGIIFIASSVGTMSGSTKGYYYNEAVPNALVKDLDFFRSQTGRSYEVFRHIEGSWYLIYQNDD